MYPGDYTKVAGFEIKSKMNCTLTIIIGGLAPG
jgi:hypothetical protein